MKKVLVTLTLLLSTSSFAFTLLGTEKVGKKMLLDASCKLTCSAWGEQNDYVEFLVFEGQAHEELDKLKNYSEEFCNKYFKELAFHSSRITCEYFKSK